MIAIDQPINGSEHPKTTKVPCYRIKSYGIVAAFALWLACSAYALGWAILDAPVGLQCVNHVK